jgi:predicted alpha-1,2-mannosidase
MTLHYSRLVLSSMISLVILAAATVFAADPTPLESAHPLIGTAEHGHVYPGATVPFGMVQLSPDTRLHTWDGCSGYHYSDKAILGFSHTHLSGTGCGDLGDIRVTPISGDVPKSKKDGIHQKFSHDNEQATPGYYSVTFNDPQIKAELTATAHAGFHRYTFPKEKTARLIFDLARGISNDAVEGHLVVEKNTVISGYRRSKGWAKDKTYYFVAEFSRPFDACVFQVNDKELPAGSIEGKDKHVIGTVNFNKATDPVLLKIGISAVSVEGARNNLAVEIPAFDFEGTIAAAKKSWSEVLNCIEIKTSDPAIRETFYTAVYHSAMAPTLFSDVDGKYRGLDKQMHEPEGFQNYCTFSLWDTFRAENPLLTIIQPQRIDDFVGSMLAHYRQFNQHSLPIWSLAGCETWCMIGYHSMPVILDAYAKGFRRYDVEAVYQAMRDTAMQDRNELKFYRELGYIPSEANDNGGRESVSRTMEFAYDDWCIAQMAKMLGKNDDYEIFSKRASNYKHLFDPSVGFVRGKLENGQWRSPFDPRKKTGDFTEGTSWNFTWFAPHDSKGLIELIGGDEKCIEKLNQMFTDTSGVETDIPDMTGLIGQYVHGNEPCHHIPYLYNDFGAPWKTQECVRNIATTLYTNKPDGICGNDDCGQMSAWYVFSAMGFYPMNPASGVYVIGSPMVDKATIHLDPKFYKNGKDFTIIAENNSPKNVYVQSATLNGKPLTRSWFSHEELAAGGELVLKMGPEPNKAWGKAPEDRPSAATASK